MSGNTPKEPRYYNLATLYQCLFGQLTSHTLNQTVTETSPTKLLYEFVKLLALRDSRERNEEVSTDLSARWEYVAGIKKGRRGGVPVFVKKNAANSDKFPLTDDEWHDDFIGFFFDYCIDNLKGNYFERLETAMDMDGNVTEKTIDNIRKLYKADSGSHQWFMAAYRAALVPYPDYFGSEDAYIQKYKEIKEEAEKRYKDIFFINPADNIPPPQYNLTKRYRRIAKEYFKRVRHSGRFEYYSLYQDEKQDSYIHDVTVTLTQGDNDSLSLEKIVFHDSDISKCTDSVSLCGKGGIGKTFLLLNMIDTILNSDKYADIIPFYIELHTVDNGSDKLDVQATLADELNDTLDDEYTKDDLKAMLKNAGSRVIIFADGMNEVIGTKKRNQIANSIALIRDKYNTRFCVSSRENHVEQFNKLAQSASGRFKEALVNDLNETQIQDHLDRRKCNISYKALPPATQVLLRTPQGVSMYSELVTRDPQKEYKFRNLGELILAYSDMILGINRDDPEPGDLLFEETLMEIAYQWVNESKFRNEITPHQIKLLSIKPNIKSIFMPQSRGEEYTFSHQNFRDVYCARFLAKMIKEICDTYTCSDHPKEFRYNEIVKMLLMYFEPECSIVPKNDEILQLVSAFVTTGKREYDREAIRIVSKFNMPRRDFTLSVLIKIFAFRSESGKSIAGLDLSGLDLRNVPLSGYELYNAKTGESAIFDGCRLGVDTFRKQGLQTSAKVIVKYKCKYPNHSKEKEYIAAFAESSAVVIDTTTGLHETVLYESNGGVECYCLSEENGYTAIYLGNQNGCITVFLPHMLDIDKKNAVQIRFEAFKKDSAIQSICEITRMGKKYLLFSTRDGKIYLIKKYSAIRREEIKFKLKMSGHFYGRCCLIPYEKHDMLIASHEREVYLIPFDHIFSLSENSDATFENNISFFKENDDGSHSPYGFDSGDYIHDIALCGDHLFINTTNEINVFKLEADNNRAYTFPEAYLSTSDLPDRVNFFYFSPCDTKNREIKVITGLGVPRFTHEPTTVKRFYELTYNEHTKKLTFSGFADAYSDEATWSGVKYESGERTFFASVSTNNDIEIDCLDDENFPRTVIHGAYNAIISIDTFADDSGRKMMLRGNHDGTVTYQNAYDADIYDVYPIHEGAVQKVLYIGSRRFLSCGMDGRLILTYMDGHEKKVLLFCHEPLTDLCLDKDMNIWTVSYNKVYKLRRSGNSWDEAQVFVPAGIDQYTLNITSIAIDDTNDSPVIFFNTGFCTEGHVVKVTNGQCVQKDGKTFSEFLPVDIVDIVDIDMPGSVYIYNISAYIQRIKYFTFISDGKCESYLVFIANANDSGYIFISQINSSSSDKPKAQPLWSFSSAINDCVLTKRQDGKYYLFTANANNFISSLLFDLSKLLKCRKADEVIYNPISSPPKCITAFDDQIICGTTSGDVYHFKINNETGSDISDNASSQISIVNNHTTFADLLSSKMSRFQTAPLMTKTNSTVF